MPSTPLAVQLRVTAGPDLKAKAELQMAEARQTEATASHNFQMRQQFSEDELKFNAQDLEAAKHSAGEAQGQLTTDTADLKMMEDALAEDKAALEDTTRDCQAKVVKSSRPPPTVGLKSWTPMRSSDLTEDRRR